MEGWAAATGRHMEYQGAENTPFLNLDGGCFRLIYENSLKCARMFHEVPFQIL